MNIKTRRILKCVFPVNETREKKKPLKTTK
jgi:hypothetical protein